MFHYQKNVENLLQSTCLYLKKSKTWPPMKIALNIRKNLSCQKICQIIMNSQVVVVLNPINHLLLKVCLLKYFKNCWKCDRDMKEISQTFKYKEQNLINCCKYHKLYRNLTGCMKEISHKSKEEQN